VPAVSPKLVTVREFRDLPEALLAKSVLDSEGIESYLFDENMIRLDWFLSYALGGIKLRVKEEDAKEARELLEQGPPERFEAGEAGEYEQPKCPRCGSLKVDFGEKGKHLAYATVAVGVPLPVGRHGWRCRECGHEWEDAQE
jgi:Putative prokaryotic signal transducing protein